MNIWVYLLLIQLYMLHCITCVHFAGPYQGCGAPREAAAAKKVPVAECSNPQFQTNCARRGSHRWELLLEPSNFDFGFHLLQFLSFWSNCRPVGQGTLKVASGGSLSSTQQVLLALGDKQINCWRFIEFLGANIFGGGEPWWNGFDMHTWDLFLAPRQKFVGDKGFFTVPLWKGSSGCYWSVHSYFFFFNRSDFFVKSCHSQW